MSAEKVATCPCLSCTLKRALVAWGDAQKADGRTPTNEEVLTAVGFFAGIVLGSAAVTGKSSPARATALAETLKTGIGAGIERGSVGYITGRMTNLKVTPSASPASGRMH